jgi:hypothetical protein
MRLKRWHGADCLVSSFSAEQFLSLSWRTPAGVQCQAAAQQVSGEVGTNLFAGLSHVSGAVSTAI